MIAFPSPQQSAPPPTPAESSPRGGFDSETFRSIQRRASEHLAQQALDQATLHSASEREQVEHQYALQMHAEAQRLKAGATRKAVMAGAAGFLAAFLLLGKK